MSGNLIDDVAETLHWREADCIYASVFGVPAPSAVRHRFLEPSRVLNAAAHADDVARHYRAVERGVDLEALELACRWRRLMPLTSQKFRLVMHLAETLPENYTHFVNPRDASLVAGWQLAGAGLRTALKLPVGLLILRSLHAS